MTVDALDQKFDMFMAESRVWRDQLTRELRENSAQTKCLSIHFAKYKPQLEEGLNRRKWWSNFWEERRAELITYSVRGGAFVLVGLVMYAIASKFIAWVKSVLHSGVV